MTKTLNIIMEYKDTTEPRKLILNSPEHLRLFLIYENSPEDYAGDIPALLTVVPTNASLKVFKNNNDILSLHWRKGDIREVVAVVLRADSHCQETLDYWPNLHSYAKMWQSERKSIIKSLLPVKSRGDTQPRSQGDSGGNSGNTVSRLTRERRSKQDSNKNSAPRNASQLRQDSRITSVDHAKVRREAYAYPPYVGDGHWNDPYLPHPHPHRYPHLYPHSLPPRIAHDPYHQVVVPRMYGPPSRGLIGSGASSYPRTAPVHPPYYRGHADGYNPPSETVPPDYTYHPTHSNRPGIMHHPHESGRQMEAHPSSYEYPVDRRPAHSVHPSTYDDVPPHYHPSYSSPYPPSYGDFDVPASHVYQRTKYHSSLQCLEPPYDTAPHTKAHDRPMVPPYKSQLDKAAYSDFPGSTSELFPERAPVGPRGDVYHPLMSRNATSVNQGQPIRPDRTSNAVGDEKYEQEMKPSVDTSIIGDPTTAHPTFSS